MGAAPSVAKCQVAGSSRGPAPNSFAVRLPSFGGKRRVLATLGASGTYTTGGDSFSPSVLGLKEVHNVFILANDGHKQAALSAGHFSVDVTDPKTPKIKWTTSGSTEGAAATTLSLSSFTAIFEGI